MNYVIFTKRKIRWSVDVQIEIGRLQYPACDNAPQRQELRLGS